ncbi:MAG TPA: hypothetical protein VIP11_06420 [Gemmatimonadaceae bacterium]
MNARLRSKRMTSKESIVFSLVFHVFAIAAIMSITFRYPLAAFFGMTKEKMPVERIQYISVQPRQRADVGNGASEEKPKRDPKKKTESPAQLLPPSTIPTALPPIPPPNVSVGAITGTGTGSGGAPVGAATGVELTVPDSRIELRPNGLRLPMSTAERNDSAVKAIYMAYREAAVEAEAHRGRSPRDWTVERNGQKYGVDSQWVYLGKFKLPSAILAALPFNYGGVDGNRIIQARNAAWIQNDIYTHSQGLSEDDFRAAVRRIRERKDREKKEAEEKGKASPKTTPIVP